MYDKGLGDQATPPKKGYSIRTLLVIMTLLAVWMVIPRLIVLRIVRDNAWDIFFVIH